MAVADVIDLSGVGPAVARRLNEYGVFTTGDLLRVERRRLADEVQGASLAQVLRWQSISELMEVDGITLPVAEGLHSAGVETLDELAGRSLSQLRAVFKTLQQQGVIGAMRSDDELVASMTDALLLRHTGTLNGTVTDADGAPIVGVTASCMRQQAQSDERGRFRLRRLPLGGRLLVHLQHPDYAPKSVKVRAAAPAGVLTGERFGLVRRRAGAPGLRVLSELAGDKLPAFSGASITIRVQQGVPSPLDILQVNEFLPNGDVRIISRLFDYDGETFIVRSYRFERNDLPRAVRVGDHLCDTGDGWQVVTLTQAAVDRHRRWLRQRGRRVPKPPANAKAADIKRYVESRLQAYSKG